MASCICCRQCRTETRWFRKMQKNENLSMQQRLQLPAMLRSFRVLARSVTASACTRMFSHGTLASFSAVKLLNFAPNVKDPIRDVKYSDSNTIADHVRSLIILPESSFVFHDEGDPRHSLSFSFSLTCDAIPGVSELKLQKRTYQVSL